MSFLFLSAAKVKALAQALAPHFTGSHQEALINASDVTADAVMDVVQVDIDNIYGTLTDLQSIAGADLIGITDVGNKFTATTVEDALQEVATEIETAVTGKLDASAVSAFGLTLVDDADASAARTTLGLGTAATASAASFQPAGSYQTQDATLTGIAATAPTANQGLYASGTDVFTTYNLTAGGRALGGVAGTINTFPYFSAANVVTLGAITAFGRSLVDDADAATARTTLGLGTAATSASTAFQASDATLTALAGLTVSADRGVYATGADAFSTYTLTAFGRTIGGSADAAAARTSLALGSVATKNQTVSTAAPSGTPADGDVWLKYTP